jgi:putative transcriptional regulator
VSAAVLVAVLVTSGAPARSALKPGVFLYAVPDLPDPNFAETVVLLLDHGPKGSMGLVVNRPTRVPLRELLPDLDAVNRAGVGLHWGGPVSPGGVAALLRSPGGVEGGRRVLDGVHLCTETNALKRALGRKDASTHVRIFAGYTGWGAGQLDSEMAAGGWVVGPADAASVFSGDPESLWPRVHDLLKRTEARAAVR